MPIALTKGLDEKCCDCGIALYKKEITGELGGWFIDYVEHEEGDVHLKFCSGCWERIKEIMKRDQGDAILKRKELEREGAKHTPAQIDVFIENDDNFDFRTPDPNGVGM